MCSKTFTQESLKSSKLHKFLDSTLSGDCDVRVHHYFSHSKKTVIKQNREKIYFAVKITNTLNFSAEIASLFENFIITKWRNTKVTEAYMPYSRSFQIWQWNRWCRVPINLLGRNFIERRSTNRSWSPDFWSMSIVSDDGDRSSGERNRTPNRRASVVEKTTISRQIDRKVTDYETSSQLSLLIFMHGAS